MNDHLNPILDPHDPSVVDAIDNLARSVGANPDTLKGRQIVEMLTTVVKLLPEGRHGGELKLLNNSLKELRYAFSIFAPYKNTRKVSIFGSARTPEDHPDYAVAVEFARRMAKEQWMVITGAGDGIMKAGHEGPGRKASFGVSIRLPFETNANSIIAGDDKLINFRYFFTRKVMFVGQSDAVVLFPGGFGTQDENFETLTLIQTGKSQMVPVVMLSGDKKGAQTPGGYWREWDRYVQEQLLERNTISTQDLSLYYLAEDHQDAADHVIHFYKNYHSNRYVNDDLVIRIKNKLNDEQVNILNEKFSDLVASGNIIQRSAFAIERALPDLPRIVFHHTKRDWGRVRQLIDTINDF